jgi:hypothetical protein
MLPPAGEVWTFFWLACNSSQLSCSISQRSRYNVFISLTHHVNQHVTLQFIKKYVYLYARNTFGILNHFYLSTFFARAGEPLPCLGQNSIKSLLSSSIVCTVNLFGYPDWGFSVLFPQLQGKCQGKTRRQGTASTSPNLSFCFLFVLFCC